MRIAVGLRWLMSLCCLLALPALGQPQTQGVDPVAREITLAISSEPPTLNTIRATDQVSSMVVEHIIEGLTTYDGDNRLIPGVAERWELTETRATFWLRRDARWSDGRPVTADDFIFAWQRAVDPKSASEYAFILFSIQNAEAINSGKLPPEALGVSAPDDYTLQVELAQPTPYFIDLTAFTTFKPVRRDFFTARGERYAADAGDLLFNGPFMLTRWVHGASLRLEKNPHYWNRDKIFLNAINIPYITTDGSVHLNLFYDGKVAYVDGLSDTTLPEVLKRRLKMNRFMDGGVFFVDFNHRPERLTRNLHLRKAIQAVINNNELVNKVVATPGNKVLYSLFPTWIRGVSRPFHEEHPAPRPSLDIQVARAHLEQARRELGVTEIPPLSLLTDDGPRAMKEAEWMQSVLQRTLGITLKIDQQIFKQRLAKMSSGDFDLVAAGWGPDYNDAMTFGDLMASWNMNNRGRYENPEYDHWVRVAQGTIDTATRVHAFAQMQRILFEDAALIVKYERGKIWLVDPRLQGVSRRIFGGDPNFNAATIVEPH